MSQFAHGVGVVIDDEIGDANSGIFKIVTALQTDSKIPIVKYTDLPDDDLKNWHNVSFVILDWDLSPHDDTPDPSDVPVGAEFKAQKEKSVVGFIKLFQQTTFAPIYLLSRTSADTIKERLRQEKVYTCEDNDPLVLVESKDSFLAVRGAGVEEKLSGWVKTTPAIHLLMRWSQKLAKAKAELFQELHVQHAAWPRVLWDTYQKDGDDPDHALGDLLMRNLRARMLPKAEDDGFVPAPVAGLDRDSFRKVLEASVMISQHFLKEHPISCGDIFWNPADRKYRINIRCECDCVPRKDKNGVEIPGQLFLLSGTEVPDTELTGEPLSVYDMRYGFDRPFNAAYVFPIDGGKCVKFCFGSEKIKTVKKDDLSLGSRIGRLLPPYITDIRQRYSQWIQREGFPKVPHEAIICGVVPPSAQA